MTARGAEGRCRLRGLRDLIPKTPKHLAQNDRAEAPGGAARLVNLDGWLENREPVSGAPTPQAL